MYIVGHRQALLLSELTLTVKALVIGNAALPSDCTNFYSENVIDGIIEIEKETDSEKTFLQRGCATVVNDKMMYFGGSIDPMQVCHFSNNFFIYVTTTPL